MTQLQPYGRLVNVDWEDVDPNFGSITNFRIFLENIAEVWTIDAFDLLRVDSIGCFSPLNLDPLVEILDKKVTIYGNEFPGMNKRSRIIFYNVAYREPKVLKDGVDCTDCSNMVFDSDASTYTVDVAGFSTYEIVEGYQEQGGGGSPGGGGGSSGRGKYLCKSKWDCSPWGECINARQRRVCADVNQCEEATNIPKTVKSCQVKPKEQEEEDEPDELATVTDQIKDALGIEEITDDMTEEEKTKVRRKNVFLIAVYILIVVLILLVGTVTTLSAIQAGSKEKKL